MMGLCLFQIWSGVVHVLKEKKTRELACASIATHLRTNVPFLLAQNFIVTTTESVGPFAASFALKIGQ